MIQQVAPDSQMLWCDTRRWAALNFAERSGVTRPPEVVALSTHTRRRTTDQEHRHEQRCHRLTSHA